MENEKKKKEEAVRKKKEEESGKGEKRTGEKTPKWTEWFHRQELPDT